MYIQNPLYSNVDLYLIELNKYLKKNYELKADYKTYDKQNDDNIMFIIFDIKSKLKNIESNFIIKEFNYVGKFTFYFNKLANHIIVKEIPIINFNNKIKLPIFTQDLANILVEKISKYVKLESITISFENNLSVIVIDDTVKDLIPSIKETRNYKLLTIILETIAKEIKNIRQDVINHKAHYDKVERSKEKAINKKRVILGINPLEYESEEKFNNVLNERIKEAYIRKHAKAKRHLELSENKYKKLLDNERLYDYFNFIFNTYLAEKTEKEIPLEFKDIVLDAREEFRRYLIRRNSYYDTIDSGSIKYCLKYWLEESNFYERYKKDFINAVYSFDLNNKLGALSIIKKVKSQDDIRYDEYGRHQIDSDEWIKWFCIEIYNLPQAWMLNEEDKILLKYHPIFYDKAIYDKLLRDGSNNGKLFKQFANRYFFTIEPCYKSHEFASGYNLLYQIPRLIEIEKKCADNVKNIDKMVLDFRTFSASWGNIINLPYWSVEDTSNHTTRGGYSREIFIYFVVKPGIQKIDFSKIKCFGRNWSNKLISAHYSANFFEDCVRANRLMIFLPKSLNYKDIITILNNLKYTENDFSYIDIGLKTEVNNNENQIFNHSCSKWLNIICEDLGVYLFIKKYLMKKLINKDILPTRIFVNYDPEYYKNYLVEVPSAEILWHKYDYIISNYKYNRKYLFDLRGQLIYAKEYLNDILDIYEDNSEYYDILEEILLGSYSSNPKYKKYINDFQEFLLLHEINVIGGKVNTPPEKIKDAIYSYNKEMKKYSSVNPRKKLKYTQEKALKLLIEGQKLREKCAEITKIPVSIEGEEDCVSVLYRKYKN